MKGKAEKQRQKTPRASVCTDTLLVMFVSTRLHAFLMCCLYVPKCEGLTHFDFAHTHVFLCVYTHKNLSQTPPLPAYLWCCTTVKHRWEVLKTTVHFTIKLFNTYSSHVPSKVHIQKFKVSPKSLSCSQRVVKKLTSGL